MILLMAGLTGKQRSMLAVYYERHKYVMSIIIDRILHDKQESQDVLQDTFIAIAKEIGKISLMEEADASAYIIGMARNRALNVYNRRMNYSRKIIEITIPEPEDDPVFLDVCKRLGRNPYLARCLKEINEGYAEMIFLRCTLEKSVDETADYLNISKSNVYARFSRAKKALRAILDEERCI